MHVSVKVKASARLHLGFLDLDGGTGRRFGSLGLAIERPVTSLTIERAPATRVEGPERERVIARLAALRGRFGLKSFYAVSIHEAIPAHVGLGSGTQLALAIAAALRRLEDLPPDTMGDALFLQRGLRSGIGAALFSTGDSSSMAAMAPARPCHRSSRASIFPKTGGSFSSWMPR